MKSDSLKNMSLFVDGKGYAGCIEEITLPKLALKTEEFHAGGMDVPIEIETGMEKLECGFTLHKFDKAVLGLFGIAPGKLTPLTIRGSLLQQETGEEIPILISLRGMVKELDFGTWKQGEAASVKMAMALHYYRYEQNNEEIHEIDVDNMVRKIDGVDLLATTRQNLGI